MKDLVVLFLKEWRENTRNFKILWIPLVFIFFGITEPVMNYYLPQITGGAAGISLILVLGVQLIDSLLGAYWTVSPWKVSTYATQWLTGSPDLSDFWWSIIVTTMAIIALVTFGVWMSKRNALKTKV